MNSFTLQNMIFQTQLTQKNKDRNFNSGTSIYPILGGLFQEVKYLFYIVIMVERQHS
jgi:hypothetical protein